MSKYFWSPPSNCPLVTHCAGSRCFDHDNCLIPVTITINQLLLVLLLASCRARRAPSFVGDASMASPFTAKAASVAPVTDILKQGRCTLVTTVQMFKVLGLLCLSTAYALSVMYLQGVKLSDAQVCSSCILLCSSIANE